MSWAAVAGAAVGVVGGAIANKNSKSNAAVSTSTSDPWWGQQSYLHDLFNRAQGTSLDPSDYTKLGDSMAINRATQGSPLNSAAQDALLPTIRGDYLDPGTNPAWGPMSQRITDAYQTGTAAQTDAAFNRAGTFGLGNSAYEQQVGRNQQGLGDSLSMLAGNLYNNERQNQMQGINIAPFTAEAQYADADRLRTLGEQRTWGPLFNYQQLINGQGGGQTTNSQPLYSNPMNSALGGALLGNQLFGGQQQTSGANQNWASQGSSTPFFGDYGWGNV